MCALVAASAAAVYSVRCDFHAIARAKLGPLCPTGIVAPDKDEVDATLADWLNEVERVQLMLRLTPRLRQKYQD
jgi:hypothetical protein